MCHSDFMRVEQLNILSCYLSFDIQPCCSLYFDDLFLGSCRNSGITTAVGLTFGHLFYVVGHNVDWPTEVILNSSFLWLRTIGMIMYSLLLAFHALQLYLLSCAYRLGKTIEIISIIVNSFSMGQHIFEAYATSCV